MSGLTNQGAGRLPLDPVALDEVRQLFPTLRQSTLVKMDGCHLSTLFDLNHEYRWSSHPAAAGTIFHRFAAECLRTMVAAGERKIPQEEAMVILYETVRQRGVRPADRVVVSLDDVETLRQAALNFSSLSFSVDRIVAIEQRLEATTTYVHPQTGELVERTVTGQPDMILWEGNDGIIVLDWKHTWALPPERKDDGEPEPYPDARRRLSWLGYPQQRVYGWLLFRNFDRLQRMTMREFYALRKAPREATINRADMEHLDREVSFMVEQFDVAVAAGTRDAGTGTPGDAWPASGGRHCALCAAPSACPIPRRERRGGEIESMAQAEELAAEFVVADEVRKRRAESLKHYLDQHGGKVAPPVPVKGSKGNYVLGWRQNRSGGWRFELHVPDESARGPKGGPELAAAAQESADEARRADGEP